MMDRLKSPLGDQPVAQAAGSNLAVPAIGVAAAWL
jgi:hypothetical protein